MLDPVAELKSDHKQVRDLLLSIISASEKRNAAKALEGLLKLDKLGGPHFQWEEESFYPTLKRFFGNDYYDYLISVHDRIIRAARQLAAILGKGEISQEEGKKVVSLVRSEILPHPIECEGLTLFSDRLTESELNDMAKKFEVTRKANHPLLEWADKVRPRKVT